MTDVEFNILMFASVRMTGWLFALEDDSWHVKFGSHNEGIGISFVHEQDAVMFRLAFGV
jgi:hypothetical protein